MELPNLTNYGEHPADPEWLVFRFADTAMAEEFARGLAEAGLRHERDTEPGPPFLVGVRRVHRDQAVRLNYTVLGRHRKHFLPDARLRWGLIGLVALLLALAAAGALLGG
ncbi:MAG: hypothetical protein QY325_07660 [Flavobacteriales bacterium]|jgi:hypothetical protein|nr:MAG: hypothetical protein QY325_07660 [Flavobacteriales bacterium]